MSYGFGASGWGGAIPSVGFGGAQASFPFSSFPTSNTLSSGTPFFNNQTVVNGAWGGSSFGGFGSTPTGSVGGYSYPFGTPQAASSFAATYSSPFSTPSYYSQGATTTAPGWSAGGLMGGFSGYNGNAFSQFGQTPFGSVQGFPAGWAQQAQPQGSFGLASIGPINQQFGGTAALSVLPAQAASVPAVGNAGSIGGVGGGVRALPERIPNSVPNSLVNTNWYGANPTTFGWAGPMLQDFQGAIRGLPTNTTGFNPFAIPSMPGQLNIPPDVAEGGTATSTVIPTVMGSMISPGSFFPLTPTEGPTVPESSFFSRVDSPNPADAVANGHLNVPEGHMGMSHGYLHHTLSNMSMSTDVSTIFTEDCLSRQATDLASPNSFGFSLPNLLVKEKLERPPPPPRVVEGAVALEDTDKEASRPRKAKRKSAT